jgi:hypothetical protein
MVIASNEPAMNIGRAPERIDRVKACISELHNLLERTETPLNSVDASSLERASELLYKIEKQHEHKRTGLFSELNPEDVFFSNAFLDLFASDAFREELDQLRQADGQSMSESDFSTLADSIRAFGIGLSNSHRELLIPGTENSD